MLAGLFAATSMLSGCATSLSVEDGVAATGKRIDAVASDVGRSKATKPEAELVSYDEGIYLGRNTFKIETVATLPQIFQQQVWFQREVANLKEIAERVTLRTSIPVVVTPDAIDPAARQAGQLQQALGAPAATGLPAVPGAATSPAGGGQAGASAQASAATSKIPFTYNGTLKGFLDTVAARFGVNWKYERDTIRFFTYDTRTFYINTVPGDSSVDASIAATSSLGTTGSSGSNTNGGNSGASSSKTSVKSSLSVWGALEQSIKAMLTKGGQVVAAPATNTITVTDTPDVLGRVSEYIDHQNDMLGKQIAISVTVLGVTSKDSDAYNISWEAVYNNLYQKYGLKNVMSPIESAINFSAGIIKSGSKFEGSQMLIEALSTQANIRLETTASVTTLNNQPAPIQVGSNTSYLQSGSTTNTANVGTQSSITLGTVTSGFAMTVLPSVMPDGRVIMQFSADISARPTIVAKTSGGLTVEAPQQDFRQFLQRVTMHSGETLILTGFQQTDGQVQYSGVGSPKMPLLGGGQNASARKEQIVILVTPLVSG